MNVGLDIVLVSRFNGIINNRNFINKVFTNKEIEYIKNTNYNVSTIAGIYASKEALLKSIKKGINDYNIKDIEILHDSNNAPYIKLHNKIYIDYKNKSFCVSISHDGNYAISIVIASNI